jgi:hypothetical protein
MSTVEERSATKSFLWPLLQDVGIACVCAAVFMSLLGAKSTRLTATENAHAERIRQVIRAELVFAGERASAVEVRRSVASVGAFVERRADLRLDPAVFNRLVDLEQRTLDGRLRRLSVHDVSDIFSTILCEKVRDLNDSEIASAAEGFENVVTILPHETAGDEKAQFAVAKRMRGVPPSAGLDRPPNDVMLRADGSGNMTTDRFVTMAKDFRARLQSPSMFVLVTGQATTFLEDYLDKRLSIVERAVPESWGSARSGGLTPVQAFMTAYSSASDDMCAFTSDELVRMQRSGIEAHLPATVLAKQTGLRTSFGRYGDLFSTPLDMALDARTLEKLLDRIEERASR